MKKQIVKIATAFAIGAFVLVSCSENSETNATTTESHDGHNHAIAYQCPMDCENGKTYEQPGKCPVCNMKLAELEHNH